ncbi:hypothetical protein PHLCEN_2v12537, partial [Hermanssonia centrifuga]
KQPSTACRQWPPWKMHAARPDCFKLLGSIAGGPSLLHEASDAHLVDFHA